jgi:tetratricopeptide (TPR) repeat protein
MHRRNVLIASVVFVGGAVLALVLSLGRDRASAPAGDGPSESGSSGARPTPPLTAHAAELARLDEQIRARVASAREHPDDWRLWEEIAALWIDRARLSGDYGDDRQAERAIERAFEIAPEGSGPYLTRARLHVALRRLERVGPDLAAAEQADGVTPRDRRAIRLLRADVAFHTGDYSTAELLYTEQLAEERSVESLTALAELRWKTGRFEEAERLLDEATTLGASESAWTRAWVQLVRGDYERDRGRLDAAMERYRAGLREFSGYWLLERHVAEIHAEQGRLEEAERLYEDLVRRTARPEVMDGLARIARERGDRARFEAWRDRARAIYEQQLEAFPEAAYPLALDHWLELEDDPARAVELAERNRDRCPNGESRTKLAQAYLRAGRLADARGVIDGWLLTPWSTAESHATAALVYELGGDAARAAEHRARAEAIAAGANERLGWLRDAYARSGVASVEAAAP